MKAFSLHRLFLVLVACLTAAALAAPAGRAADAPASVAATESKTSPAQDNTATSQDKTAPAQDKTATAQDKIAPAQDKTATAQDKTAPVQDKTAPESGNKAAPKAARSKPAPKTGGKAAPAQSKTAPGAGRTTASKSASPAAKNPEEVLHQKLEEFGRGAIEKMNRHALPSLHKKEVKKNADGSYTARYVAIDPESLRVSFKKAEPAGTVSHIGYLHYAEKEYFCTAPTEAEAKNGHFEPKISRGQTELIKYMRGKWSY
jgi:outer membrane biosynthesis protein TonB